MKNGGIGGRQGVAWSLTPALDAETLRIVNALQIWERPAQPVNVYYIFPSPIVYATQPGCRKPDHHKKNAMIMLRFSRTGKTSRTPVPFVLITTGCILLQSTGTVRAQQRDTTRTPVVYTSVPHIPEPGLDLMAYLVKNIKFPKPDTGMSMTTRVVTRFVVSPDGRLSDIRIIKGMYPQFDQEVVRVLRSMSPWTPGKLADGTPVAVYYTLPVSFEFR